MVKLRRRGAAGMARGDMYEVQYNPRTWNWLVYCKVCGWNGTGYTSVNSSATSVLHVPSMCDHAARNPKEYAQIEQAFVAVHNAAVDGYQLRVQAKNDGTWLEFISSKGRHAVLRVENLAEGHRGIIGMALREWCDDQQALRLPATGEEGGG